jgi:hypothetical protein
MLQNPKPPNLQPYIDDGNQNIVLPIMSIYVYTLYCSLFRALFVEKQNCFSLFWKNIA